ELLGSASVFALGSFWLIGLWGGWVLIFLGLADPLAHSGHGGPVSLADIIYFVGFTLSTLGIGDLTPESTYAQMATTLASFNGLLVVTLIVTYALSVVSGVVARRVLALKIYLVGGDEGEFLRQFESFSDFTHWLTDIRKELMSCTEQRLAYPVLDNFISRSRRFSLPVQIARVGLAAMAENRNSTMSQSQQAQRELTALFSVLDRYTSITGLTDEDLAARLRKLGERKR
ncbi:MAG: ion channel, partial [Marinobacter sp.]